MPFGPYKDFKDCVAKNRDKRSPEGFCAWLEKKIQGGDPLKLLTRELALAILKKPNLLRKDSDSKLIDDHRWIHWWAAALKAKHQLFLTRKQLKKLHDIYVREFDRRGLDHKSPVRLGGLMLSASMLQQILDKRKPFLVEPEYISYGGSSVSDKALPGDVDSLFKSPKNEEYGRRYIESLPEDLRGIQHLVWESGGPCGPYIPGYELWALPTKEISMKEPRYSIALFSPFSIPRSSRDMDRETIFGVLEDDYFVIVPPSQSIRLTVHRKETEIMVFDEDNDEYKLSEIVAKEFLKIEEPRSFIVDGFLTKREGVPIFELMDMPWWRDSEHISKSARTRLHFLFRLPETPHIRFAIMHHFENRQDLVDHLKQDDGRYLIIPGSSIYSIDKVSEWISFDGSKEMDLAEGGSDEKIKGLIEAGKWEDLGADARFRLMTKRKRVEPLFPFAQLKTTKKGYSLREVFGIKSVEGLAKEIFRVPNKIGTEVKIDGFRVQAHRKGDQVKLFTESGHEITAQLPTLVADMKKIPPKEAVFDCEATPYDETFRNLGRAGAAPAFAKGAKGPVDDSMWALHIFDLLYMNGEDLRNMPYSERRERLKGVELPVRDAPRSKADFKTHLWENTIHVSTSADRMVKDAEAVSKEAGSEGAMFKQLDSKYRLSGNTPLWSKMKISFEIDAMVVGIIKKGSIINYIGAIGPVTGIDEAESAPLDTAKGKKFVNWKGKTYSILGKTFNTKLKAELGQIIRVTVKNVSQINENIYHWFHPQVLEVREDKTSPDPLQTAATIAKTVKKAAAYLINTRYGLESSLACCHAPWIAIQTDDGFTYLQNNDELCSTLHTLGVDHIVGQRIMRERAEQFLEAKIDFVFSSMETIRDFQGRPLMLDEPWMPDKVEVDFKRLKTFYDGIRSKEYGSLTVPLKEPLLLADVYLTYPDESKPWEYVIQFHIRGLSVHADFRIEFSKTQLLGWTWDLGKSLIKPMLRRVKSELLSKVGLTKKQLDDMTISEVSAKLRSSSEGRKLRKQLSLKTQELSIKQLTAICDEIWKEEVEPILKDPGRKILTQKKPPQPHEWLTYEREVPAGGEGATAELKAQFIIMDKGTAEFGAQKTYYHEYFLNGDRIGRRRVVARRLATRAKWRVKEAFAWMTFFTKPGERSYVISTRAKQKKWMPPTRVSALPRSVRAQIPKDRQFWRAKNASEIRDALVKDLGTKKVTIKLARGLQFAVKRVWHKGPEVKRGAPIVRYWILIHDDKKVLDAWNFGKDVDPLEQDGVMARRISGKGLEELIKTTGDLPPEHPASETKKLTNHHDTSDEGRIDVTADSNSFIRARFKGDKLSGLYVFVKESPSSNTWIFKKSELPQPKKLLLSSPQMIHLAAADMKTEVIGDLLLISGVAIKPGEVIGMDGKPAFFTAKGIRKLWPSMYRQPIVAMHGELKGDVIGFVNKIHYDEERGWGIIDQGVIWHPMGIKFILEKKLPDFSIEVMPVTIWDPERKHDVVIDGKCIGCSAVPKGACATCHIDQAAIGEITVSPGQIYKFGMPLNDYMLNKYWGRLGDCVSTQDLANELGRPRSTIEMWMDHAGIPRRDHAEARHLRMVKEVQIRKFGGRAIITTLGTGAFTDIPRDECPQCKEARAGGKSRRNYTATLFRIGAEHLLINAPKGIAGMLAQKKIKPKYVLLEHIHEDVVNGLHELRPLKPIVFATKDAWSYIRRHYRAISRQKGGFEDLYDFKRYVIKPDQAFRIGPFLVRAIKVQHAKPGDPTALGFKIDIGGKTVWHCSDVYRISDYKKVLKGVDIYIGDGASLRREITHGHTSIEKQIRWAREADIPRIYFTQIGHIGKTHDELNEAFKELSPNAQALFDGAEISLGGSAPGARHSKQIAEALAQGERTMLVRAKPYSEYSKQAIYLLTDQAVVGLYVEGYPEGPYDAEKIRLEEREAHGMSNEEWKRELGDVKKVWIYRPRILKRYETPHTYDPPGVVTLFIHDVKIRRD